MTTLDRARRQLRALGHDVRPIHRALERFQRAVGLEETGRADDATLAALRKTRRTVEAHGEGFLTAGVAGERVALVERQLRQAGYDVGRVDDVFDRRTVAAVRDFKADHPRDFERATGVLGTRGQRLLSQSVGHGSTTVRATTFNWPSRYHRGGDAADLKLLKGLTGRSDVMGLPEFGWAHPRLTHRVPGWQFYNPNPRGGEREPVGQVLGWNTRTFDLVEKGTSRLSPRTRIQQQAAGPTVHREKFVTWARLRNKETGEVWTMAVAHFVPSKHLGGAVKKLWEKQRDALARWVAAQGPRTVVMGDFNGDWNAAISRPLHRVADAATAPSHERAEIDWILRSKDLRGSRGRALDHRGQSDHRPVTATVRG